MFKIKNRELIGKEDLTCDKYINIGKIILEKLMYRPNFIGQIDAETGEKNTFKQMRKRSVKCALWLQKRGIKSGDIITVCTRNQLEAYVPYLAALYIGAIMNPWPRRENGMKSYVKYFLTRVTPKVIFVDYDNAKIIQDIVKKIRISTKIVVFDNGFDEFKSLELILKEKINVIDIDTFSCVEKNIKDPAIILLSCGTTGFLKDVEVPYAIFLCSTNQIPIKCSYGGIGLWFESLDWIISLLLIVRAILMKVKAIKSSGFKEEQHLCQIIQKYKVTWIFLETNMCNRLSKFDVFGKYDISSLKKVIFGGLTIKSKVHAGLIQSLPNVFIIQVYYLPETGLIAYQWNTGKIGSSGYVARNVRLLIVDCATKEPLGPNTIGVIWCQSRSMMNGYYKDTRHTRNIIDDNGWFHSEDVGYYDEQGNIFIIDRVKQLIKYRHHYISPAEIEIGLQSLPGVSEVVVVPLPDDYDDFHTMTFIVLEPGSEKEKMKKLIKKMFNWKTVNYTVILEKMPYIFNEKINRKYLSLLAINYSKKM